MYHIKICELKSAIAAEFPELSPNDGRKCFEYGDYVYVFETLGLRSYIFGIKRKIPQNPDRLKGLFDKYGHPINKSKQIN